MYILAAQRKHDVVAAFKRYKQYLSLCGSRFPPSALALATSDWYFDPREHHCPHDAWLESFSLKEIGSGEQKEQRILAASIVLLCAHQNGYIELSYPQVFAYHCEAPVSSRGHGDWRYDEFRLSECGHVIHEIEWAGFARSQPSKWVIEASDVLYSWRKRNGT